MPLAAPATASRSVAGSSLQPPHKVVDRLHPQSGRASSSNFTVREHPPYANIVVLETALRQQRRPLPASLSAVSSSTSSSNTPRRPPLTTGATLSSQHHQLKLAREQQQQQNGIDPSPSTPASSSSSPSSRASPTSNSGSYSSRHHSQAAYSNGSHHPADSSCLAAPIVALPTTIKATVAASQPSARPKSRDVQQRDVSSTAQSSSSSARSGPSGEQHQPPIIVTGQPQHHRHARAPTAADWRRASDNGIDGAQAVDEDAVVREVPQVQPDLTMQRLPYAGKVATLWLQDTEYLTGQEVLGPDADRILIRHGGNIGTCYNETGTWFLGYIRPHVYDTLPTLTANGWKAGRRCSQKEWRPISIFVPRSHTDAEYYRPYLFQVPHENEASSPSFERKRYSSGHEGGVWARLWYPPRLHQKVHKNYWGNCAVLDEKKRVELVSVEKPCEASADGQLDQATRSASPKSRPKSAHIIGSLSSLSLSKNGRTSTQNGSTGAVTLNTKQQGHGLKEPHSLKDHLRRITLTTKSSHDV